MNNNLRNRIYFKTAQKNTKQISRPKSEINKKKSVYKKNMEWGTYTWQMLHWFAANIKEEFYIEKHIEIHSIIYNIINALPCPTCRGHAQEFMKQNNIKLAKNKAQFERFFYYFHNIVNERRDILVVDYSVLDKYKLMNGNKVLSQWLDKFNNNLGIDMNDFMSKNRILQSKNRMINFIKKYNTQFTNL